MGNVDISSYTWLVELPVVGKRRSEGKHGLSTGAVRPLTDYDKRCIAVLQLVQAPARVCIFDHIDVPGVGRVVYDDYGKPIRFRLFDEPVGGE